MRTGLYHIVLSGSPVFPCATHVPQRLFFLVSAPFRHRGTAGRLRTKRSQALLVRKRDLPLATAMWCTQSGVGQVGGKGPTLEDRDDMKTPARPWNGREVLSPPKKNV